MVSFELCVLKCFENDLEEEKVELVVVEVVKLLIDEGVDVFFRCCELDLTLSLFEFGLLILGFPPWVFFWTIFVGFRGIFLMAWDLDTLWVALTCDIFVGRLNLQKIQIIFVM